MNLFVPGVKCMLGVLSARQPVLQNDQRRVRLENLAITQAGQFTHKLVGRRSASNKKQSTGKFGHITHTNAQDDGKLIPAGCCCLSVVGRKLHNTRTRRRRDTRGFGPKCLLMTSMHMRSAVHEMRAA